MDLVDKKKLEAFLIKARTKTYAGGGGKVIPAFIGSYQLEHKEEDWLYRDVYNLGNAIFAGLETVYFKDKPVWTMSYYGDFKALTEEEADKVLRGALIENKDRVRLWHEVNWEKDKFTYSCAGYGNIDELGGEEEITKSGEKVYYFYYAGGFIG